MPDLPDLQPAAMRVAALVDGVDDADLTGPTPCEYDVATLLAHLGGLAQAFALAASKSDDPMLAQAPKPDSADLEPAWRETVPRRLAALADAWRDPAAWTGSTMAGGVALPGEVAGVVALNELTIHGWDLAAATGQSYEIDAATLAVVEHFAEESAGLPQEQREGLFGPVREVPDGASRFERVLALDGRDPAWQPSEGTSGARRE